jgi:prevent-host-death family protein
MHVGIRELKARLSRILAQARAGEVIEVISHNRPIARIVGIPDTCEAGLRGLVASGAAAWSGGKPAFAPRYRSSRAGRPSASSSWTSAGDPVLRHLGPGQTLRPGSRRGVGDGALPHHVVVARTQTLVERTGG